VQRETDEIAQLFKDQKTIQEAMLDALLGIRHNTDPTKWLPDPFKPTDPGKKKREEDTLEAIQQLLALSGAGYQQLADELTMVRVAVEEVTQATKRGLEGLSLN